VDPSMIEVSAAHEEGGVESVLSGLSEGRRSAASSFSKIRLTPEEERVYRKVDGTRTVQAIIDATGLGEFEVCRVLFDLLNRSIISTVGRGEARETIAGQIEAPPSPIPGYAVLALVAALSLAAVWTRLETPFAVAGQPPMLSASYQALLESVSRGKLQRLDRAVQAYHLWKGTIPRTLDEVVATGVVDRSYLKDPWGRPFHYALTENGYQLNAVDDRGKPDPSSIVERALPPERP
jgi:hypothetical protein